MFVVYCRCWLLVVLRESALLCNSPHVFSSLRATAAPSFARASIDQCFPDDIDSLDAAFVPGTGWPEPGGLLPREAHKLVGGVAKEGLCGMELVEVSGTCILS